MKYTLFFLTIISWYSWANTIQTPLKFVQLADNVYQHISYKHVKPWGLVGASGLVIIEGKDAHIIDTPWTAGDTEKLLKWISVQGLTVKSSVVTHFHEDASGGVPLLKRKNIPTFATELTNKLLASKQKEQSSEVITTRTYELVPDRIEVYYPGPGHSQDNIVVWLPQSQILFGGCFVKSTNSRNLGNTADASIAEWPQSIQNVMDKYPNITTVVPGHGKVGNIDALIHTSQLALKSSSK